MNANGSLNPGDMVKNERFGVGLVEFDKGATAIIRFAHGLEECEKSTLSPVLTPVQAMELPEWNAPMEVITRAQSEAISSVNDMWGVFSRSRIALLPHQLWVCRRVQERWPTRWLVADDVGLGKTIEAGLILWPLLSRGRVKRFLILAPASLVDQWQRRLLEMFDIRTARYTPEADTRWADFWNTHNQVIASLQTLRMESRGRHERFFGSTSWDLVIVDEAHHLNADERSGPTLGYELVERLVQKHLVSSVVFFTGTPHRGKDYGFWSLLKLLRPELFDPRQPAFKQLPLLRQVMIRNNKQNVTDLKGNRLFQAPMVTSETYEYSPAEDRFYAMLTEFISTGKAYASSLGAQDGRTVMLVLIAMQKLASSSVAAIRQALRRRLERIRQAGQDIERLRQRLDSKRYLREIAAYDEMENAGDLDELSRLEEQIAERLAEVRLMADEEPRLRELIAAADEVTDETKINRIISIIGQRFRDEPVLLFTEYKATQSLVMSKLIQRFGDGCVGFINGDDRADGVADSTGRARTLYDTRESVAERFNMGELGFVVSTEAGGEGIDLQERCHNLIHIDLPWNPMRLHQRVGRLNRYGQTHRVKVTSLHNPDTVESRIWEKLNDKIATIMQALREVMDEPEDLLQLVLGMTSPSLLREVFSEAPDVPQESLSMWFDEKTAKFGGRDAVDTVRDLVGHASKFDFQQVSSELPQVDLPALGPFLRAMLSLNGRRVREDGQGLSFKTPDSWLSDPGVRPYYENLVFDRMIRSRDASRRILGVGHKVLDQALKQAKASMASVTTLPRSVLPQPLVILAVADRVTASGGVVRSVVFGVEMVGEGEGHSTILRDWELLLRLNGLAEARGIRRAKASPKPGETYTVANALEVARKHVEDCLSDYGLPFQLPTVEILGVFWPLEQWNAGTVPGPEGDEWHDTDEVDGATDENGQ